MNMAPVLSARSALDGALRAYNALQGVGPAVPFVVPRVAAPSLEEFEAHFRHPPKPVIFQGLTDDWPARTKWSMAYLRERFGDRQVPVLPTKNGFMEHDAKSGLHFQWLKVNQYLDLLQSGSDPGSYLISPLHVSLPELLDDVVDPIYSRHRPLKLSRFWLSAPGTSTPLHHDLLDNFFVQIVGRKRFNLYPPADSPWLYSNSFRSGLPNFSQFDPERPDWAKFPLARGVTPIEVILEPGDMLFLPSRWWHQPRSLELSMSVNFWWADGVLAQVVRLAEWVKRMRGLEIYGLRGAST
jgi:hypothetical protein